MPRPLPRFPRPYRAVLLSPQRRGYLSGFANRSYAYNPSAVSWLWQAYDTGTKSPFGRLARLCRWCKGLGPRFEERSAPTSRKAQEPGAAGDGMELAARRRWEPTAPLKPKPGLRAPPAGLLFESC